MKYLIFHNRKFVIVALLTMCVSSAFADTRGLEALSQATGGVSSYLPYVRGACYVIATLIAVIGAMSVYSSMLLNPQNTTKRITMTVGGCITFVMMAIALPQFFGYEADGSAGNRIASNYSSDSNNTTGGNNSPGTGSSGSGGVQVYDEVSGDYIKTEIPGFDSDKWIKFPEGASRKDLETAMDLWNKTYSPNLTKDEHYNSLKNLTNKLYNKGELSVDEYHTLTGYMNYIFQKK